MLLARRSAHSPAMAEAGAVADHVMITNERDTVYEEEGGRKVLDVSYEPNKVIGSGYTIPNDVKEVNLTNNQLTVIQGLEHCTHLETLILRQNQITEVAGLERLESIRSLDLFMNSVRHLQPESLRNKPLLERMDLSFNRLKDMMELSSAPMPVMRELYLIHNKIKAIEGIEHLTSLEFLELGDNHIREIRKLDTLTKLQSLWLGRNKITAIQGLEKLTALKQLSLQSNRITTIDRLSTLTQLEELYLSHNGIQEIQGLDTLTNLRILDVSNNFIEHLDGLDALVNLEELWANDNRLSSYEEVASLARCCPKLTTIYLERNPLAEDPDYTGKVLTLLRTVTQLDALPVDRMSHLSVPPRVPVKSGTE